MLTLWVIRKMVMRIVNLPETGSPKASSLRQVASDIFLYVILTLLIVVTFVNILIFCRMNDVAHLDCLFMGSPSKSVVYNV